MSNPLEIYRAKASFDPKRMKTFLSNEALVKFENEVCEQIERKIDVRKSMEPRRTAIERFKVLTELHRSLRLNSFEDYRKAEIIDRLFIQVDHSAVTLKFANTNLFGGVLKAHASEKLAKVLQQVDKGEILGAYCLTEIGHGTNIKAMRTTATYDRESEKFIINTPDFQAAKCWSALVAQNATHAVVYAQMYLNHTHYGLNMFLVPIRDARTLQPYPGITIRDMGEKIGLNGVDNGVLIFDQYPIPRENLLGKNFEVTPKGELKMLSEISANTLAEALRVLSIGRFSVTEASELYIIKSLTIAIRYAAIRKQFGPSEGVEVPIMEYQSHQFRLFPYLAGGFVLKFFNIYVMEAFYDLLSNTNEDTDFLKQLGKELHVITAASKAVASWLARDAVQECREACGGHGYLKAAGIGDIRNDNDANCTYEGDSHVLIQQTSNWLLKLWYKIKKGEEISSPLKSINFLIKYDQILDTHFNANDLEAFRKPEVLLNGYKWLICFLLQQTSSKFEKLQKRESIFWSKNNIQVYYAKNLAVAFIQHCFLQQMFTVVNKCVDVNIKKVLFKLFFLYGYWSLEKFLPTLYQGGYVHGAEIANLIQETVLILCSEIKNEAIALIDAVAPPDFFINSILGAVDGKVYERLNQSFKDESWQEQWKNKL